MMNYLTPITPRHAPLLIAFGSAAALALAYISEYVFGLLPCELCWYQRYAYFAALGLAGLALLLGRDNPKMLMPLTFAGLAALEICFLIAVYHMGVEYGWFKGLEGCSSSDLPSDPAAALEQLMATPAIPCDKPAFVFILSMAGWNAVYASMLSGLAFVLWAQGRKNEQQ